MVMKLQNMDLVVRCISMCEGGMRGVASQYLTPKEVDKISRAADVFPQKPLTIEADVVGEVLGLIEFVRRTEGMNVGLYPEFRRLLLQGSRERVSWRRLAGLARLTVPQGACFRGPRRLSICGLEFVRQRYVQTNCAGLPCAPLAFYECAAPPAEVASQLLSSMRRSDRSLRATARALLKLPVDPEFSFVHCELRAELFDCKRMEAGSGLSLLSALPSAALAASATAADPREQLMRRVFMKLGLQETSEARRALSRLLDCSSPSSSSSDPGCFLRQLWSEDFPPAVEVIDNVFECAADIQTRSVIEERSVAHLRSAAYSGRSFGEGRSAEASPLLRGLLKRELATCLRPPSHCFFNADGSPLLEPFDQPVVDLGATREAAGWFAVLTIRHVEACETVQLIIGKSGALKWHPHPNPPQAVRLLH
eukprot:Gregarina_sp_Pseudo_9__4886@NODE_510_length_2670_cov_28_624857_g481_i0_p1_GENE_NODE_510_length_2670_cov_28_624857_g481_i0NODE_510_length_2670_cov_28_624857_g481_i0_p1_ORF_typecomplete_len423_score45_78_NODE_510_length_2670_cov_28_624857_g481_i013442612